MAWSVPLHAVANTALTAAQWNASVEANLLETAVAKATSATGMHYVGNGINSLVERQISEAVTNGSDSTTSSSYTGLSGTGPVLTRTTGTRALVWIQAQQNNTTANIATFSSFSVSGATTTASDDDWAFTTNTAAGQDTRGGVCKWATLTAGPNDFNMQYKVNSNTGNWSRRRIQVMPF